MMKQFPEDKSQNDMQIELFDASDGLHAIFSPIRVKILSMLRQDEHGFDEIVASSGRAKSTISAHLKGLLDEGIIDHRKDPEDSRKKIFFIKSNYLGDISNIKRLESDIDDYVFRYISKDEDPFEFYRLIFRTIRLTLMGQGINIDPILHDAGMNVGEALYQGLPNHENSEILDDLISFWKKHHLGRFEVKKVEPLTINVYDCFECADVPYLGRPFCAFESGMLRSIFSAQYGDKCQIKETKCYAMGHQYCCFVINKL